MNANTFLTNISKSLHSLEEQNNELSRTTNNNEFKIEEIHKNIADLATLLQQQSNLVDLVRNKMKTIEQNNEDSDESIDNEFSFNYSKSFTHKTNQKVLKSYLLFYMKDYETRGDNLSNYIIYFYHYLFYLFIYLL